MIRDLIDVNTVGFFIIIITAFLSHFIIKEDIRSVHVHLLVREIFKFC